MTSQDWNVLSSSLPSYLLDNGAFPAPVNNEGDTPEDLADDDVIREIITDAIEKQGTAMSYLPAGDLEVSMTCSTCSVSFFPN